LNHGEATASAVGSLLKEFLGPREPAETFASLLTGDRPTGLDLLVANVERRLAGAGGAWDTIDEHPSPAVVRQIHRLSCVSACGEMLTKGEVAQQLLIDELRLYWPESMRVEEMPAALEWLGTELRACHSPRWRDGTIAEGLFKQLLGKGPFAAELLEPGARLGHAVIVDGMDEFGNLVILDPWGRGTKYGMTFEEFNFYWTTNVCFWE